MYRKLLIGSCVILGLLASAIPAKAADMSFGIRLGDRPQRCEREQRVWVKPHHEWRHGRKVWVKGFYASTIYRSYRHHHTYYSR